MKRKISSIVTKECPLAEETQGECLKGIRQCIHYDGNGARYSSEKDMVVECTAPVKESEAE